MCFGLSVSKKDRRAGGGVEYGDGGLDFNLLVGTGFLVTAFALLFEVVFFAIDVNADARV